MLPNLPGPHFLNISTILLCSWKYFRSTNQERSKYSFGVYIFGDTNHYFSVKISSKMMHFPRFFRNLISWYVCGVKLCINCDCFLNFVVSMQFISIIQVQTQPIKLLFLYLMWSGKAMAKETVFTFYNDTYVDKVSHN